MSEHIDLTAEIREKASQYPDVVIGLSCNQHTFKVGKKGFLYIGPGAKGVGFKAMFTVQDSVAELKALAKKEPNRYQVGARNFVTVRFSDENPLPRDLWIKWLDESYCLATSKK